MTGKQLKAWRKRMGYQSVRDAAAALGCGRSSIYIWEKQKSVPKYIELACAQLEAKSSSSSA